MKSPRLTAVPARRSSAPVLKIRLALVLGGLAFCAAMGLFSTVAWLTAAPEPPDLAGMLAQGRGVAEVAARDYLAARPQSVPVADELDPNLGLDADPANPSKPLAYSSLAWDGFSRHEVGADRFEQHRFVVVVPAAKADGPNDKPQPPRTYLLTVTVLLTPDGPVLAASPALSPLPTGAKVKPLNYTRYKQVELSPAARAQIDDWARAYAADDGRGLYTVTGDTDQTRTYRGLGGFTAATPVAIDSAVALGDQENLVVRARVRLTSAEGFAADAEFDLLIGAATSGRPNVLAWGPAGSGAELVPFGNAIRPTATTQPN